MSKEFAYTIGDVPDKENLVGDIYYDHGHFAEITIEKLNSPIIEFYPNDEKKIWTSWTHWGRPLQGYVEILQKAMARLNELYAEELKIESNINEKNEIYKDKKDFEFEILEFFNADYHENGVIANVFHFGDPWLEISYIDGEIVMYICKHPTEKSWQMPYKDVIEALEKIQHEIKSRQQKK